MPNQKAIVPLDTIDTALVDRPARPGRFGVLCFLNKELVLGAIGLYVSHHALAPIRLIWVRHDEGRCPFGDGNDPRAWQMETDYGSITAAGGSRRAARGCTFLLIRGKCDD